MLHEPVARGGDRPLEVLDVRVEVAALEENQLLRFQSPGVGAQSLIADGQMVSRCHDHHQPCGAHPVDICPDSYAVNISTDCKVTSFRHAGARGYCPSVVFNRCPNRMPARLSRSRTKGTCCSRYAIFTISTFSSSPSEKVSFPC